MNAACIKRQRLDAMLHGSFENVNGELLKRMVHLGIDIQYVITGAKSALSKDESALLDNYRNSTPDNQAVLRKVGAALEKQVDDSDEQCA